MTSRERILTAINHHEPDRVPIDVGGGSCSTLVVEAYDNLKRFLGVSGETRVLSKLSRTARLDASVLERLGSDCIPVTIKAPSNWTPRSAEAGTYIDIWGVPWKKVGYGNGCFYWEVSSNPLAEATLSDLERYPWPDPNDPGFTEGLAEEAKSLYENTRYALIADVGFKSFWELGLRLRGFEQLLMDLALSPGFVSALMARVLEINIAVAGHFLDAVGSYIQVFRTGDDLATQNGLLCSLETFRAILKPVYKEYFDFVRSKTNAKIFFHSCGNVMDLIDDLVDTGVEILNPVQVSAMNDTAALKTRHGDKIVFWGAIDTQHVLPHGSTEDVEAEVRRRIHDLGPGGGFVLAPVHNLQVDVPPQNILAMTDAARKYGTYPLHV
jgi:uroporphyrinogen decarboxylase